MGESTEVHKALSTALAILGTEKRMSLFLNVTVVLATMSANPMEAPVLVTHRTIKYVTLK